MATITVSRQYGSGGDEIAIRVAEMLGYRYFDKELIAQAADEVGLKLSEVVDFSEDNYQAQGFMERLLGTSRKVAPQGQEVGLRSDRYPMPKSAAELPQAVAELDEASWIHLVRESIRAAHAQGNIVIVGRGGQAILREEPGVLHVRIQAGLEIRARRIFERGNFSWGGARELALKRDQASAEYLERFYNIDWADSYLYDLVINTSKLDPEAAAHIVVKAVEGMPQSE